MSEDTAVHPLLKATENTPSSHESPRSMLDGLLQRWVEDMMTGQKDDEIKYYIYWQPAVIGRNVESFAQNVTLWGQTFIKGMHHPSQAAPIILLGADNEAIRLIVESFLGPKSMPPADQDRIYTAFEQSLVERFWAYMLEVLSQTWKSWETSHLEGEGVSFEWGGTSNFSPLLGRIYDGMMAWPFLMRDHDNTSSGTCYVIIPHVTLEPLLPQLQERFAGDSLGHDMLWHEHWQNTMSDAVCTLEVRMPAVTHHLRDVLKWDVGTQIDMPPLTVAHAYCHDYHVMTGSVGHKNGHMAFQMKSFDTYNERSHP